AGAEVVFEVPESLFTLMQGLPVASRIQLVPTAGALPAIDYQLPLMSLPLVCNTAMDNSPAPVPYLNVQSDLTRQWEQQI
ncbi:hypothetical protein ABTE23_21515, partial [Acinetobacter baumannii]